tara:strand:- start:7742 stop:8497 length:756 start_codon:yes stop_codon:yes gene_type:complete
MNKKYKKSIKKKHLRKRVLKKSHIKKSHIKKNKLSGGRRNKSKRCRRRKRNIRKNLRFKSRRKNQRGGVVTNPQTPGNIPVHPKIIIAEDKNPQTVKKHVKGTIAVDEKGTNPVTIAIECQHKQYDTDKINTMDKKQLCNNDKIMEAISPDNNKVEGCIQGAIEKSKLFNERCGCKEGKGDAPEGEEDAPEGKTGEEETPVEDEETIEKFITPSFLSQGDVDGGKQYCGEECIKYLNKRLAKIDKKKDCWF